MSKAQLRQWPWNNRPSARHVWYVKSQNIDACHRCDVLIHEAHTPAWLATRPETFRRFSTKYHTTTPELAKLALKAKPGLLIIYHHSSLSPEELFDDMLARYSGHFVVGRDLDVY